MRKPDLADIGWAFAIGAMLGIGAALLLRSDDDEEDEDRADAMLRQLRADGYEARIARGRYRRDLETAVAAARHVARTD